MRQILETERCLLREMDESDRRDLAEILQDAQAMYAYEHAFSDQEVDDWLRRQMERYRRDGFGLWAVVEKNTGAFLGQCGLTLQDAGGRMETEVGYLFKRKYWHRGFAAETAIACRDYAFSVLGKERVVSIIRDNNLPSQKVAQRNGMKPTGRFVKHYYGIDMPHIVFTVEKREIEGDKL